MGIDRFRRTYVHGDSYLKKKLEPNTIGSLKYEEYNQEFIMPAVKEQLCNSEKFIKSASHPKTNTVIFDLIRKNCLSRTGPKILDFGCGRGHMCQKVGQFLQKHQLEVKDHLLACDIDNQSFPQEFLIDYVKVSQMGCLSD